MFHVPNRQDIKTILWALLFCGTPLIFSHLCILFGIDFHPFSSGYERYKVYFIVGLSLVLSILSVTDKKKDIVMCISKYLPYILVGVLWSVVWFGIEHHTFSEIIYGTREKGHGILFLLALVGLFLSLQQAQEARKYIARWSLYGGILVSLYALVQYMGLDPIVGGYWSDGWNTERVFSTLGNPNYLSGYLLLLLPLLGELKRWQKISLWTLFSIVIGLTGSVIAMALLVLYFLWKVSVGHRNNLRVGLMGSILLLVALCSYFFLPHEKLLSIMARISLWKEALVIFVHNPLIFIFGNGPDTIIQYISSHGIIFDSHYFVPSSITDSFHSIIIDSVFFFGFPIILLAFLGLGKRWCHFSHESKEGIVLFMLFFSMNIAISVHFLLLVFYITRESGKKE